jgi:hypothetical protein
MTGVGASVKFFESSIAGDNASTVAMDVGSVVRVPQQPLWFGASILNIGHGLKFIDQTTPLPLTFSVGAAARIADSLNFAVDVKRFQRNKTTDVVTGFEYFLLPTAQIRLGYASGINNRLADNNAGLSGLGNWQGGLGLEISGYQLDYAISSDNESDALQRISLSRVF